MAAGGGSGKRRAATVKAPACRTLSMQLMDLPTSILLSIMTSVTCTRSRNSMALVCSLWRDCERQTREHLALRKSVFDLLHVPSCFKSVVSLDLSMCSPWGSSLLCGGNSDHIVATLTKAFPRVKKLIVYARERLVIEAVAAIWPQLEEVSLVRWHKKGFEPAENQELGADLLPILRGCNNLRSLDLSKFFCWQEDAVRALCAAQASSHIANLKSLNLMTMGLSSNGFKSSEILAIAQACPGLKEFHCICNMEAQLSDTVNDETLAALGAHCPSLQVLELVELWAWLSARSNSDGNNPTITAAGVVALIWSLPDLQELSLQLWRNLPNSGALMEELALKCPNLTKLRLGGLLDICNGSGEGGGLARCGGLREVSITRCPGLNDSVVTTIATSCQLLRQVTICNCPDLTYEGLASLAAILQKSLKAITIGQCQLIPTIDAIRALAHLRPTLEFLQLDCDWRNLDVNALNIDPSQLKPGALAGAGLVLQQQQAVVAAEQELVLSPWACLRELSLWAQLGTLLTPLAMVGLVNCPVLERVRIGVGGDCRNIARPPAPVFGLGVLARFPQLTDLCVDLSEVTGFTMTCQPGFVDVTLWERFYLHGVQFLHTETLQYWPPSDADHNRRALSLPSAAILSDCSTARRIFLHGIANEHLLSMLLRGSRLRDLHVWTDFWPAPDDDMSTEMRIAASKRLESALDSRNLPD